MNNPENVIRRPKTRAFFILVAVFGLTVVCLSFEPKLVNYQIQATAPAPRPLLPETLNPVEPTANFALVNPSALLANPPRSDQFTGLLPGIHEKELDGYVWVCAPLLDLYNPQNDFNQNIIDNGLNVLRIINLKKPGTPPKGPFLIGNHKTGQYKQVPNIYNPAWNTMKVGDDTCGREDLLLP